MPFRTQPHPVLFALAGSMMVANLTAAQTPAGPAPAITTGGSTPTHRSQVDTSPGNVYIYVGGSFLAGTHPVAFQYLFDFTESGNTSGYSTPLLFERIAGELYTLYVVRGIGKGFKVDMNSLPRTIPFEMINGVKVCPGGNFTFGFVNAIVDAGGSQLASSPGAVDMDNPADTGQGVGAAGTTNDWSVTNLRPFPTVSLGTTFGAQGSGADYVFWGSFRTYSAQAYGLINTP